MGKLKGVSGNARSVLGKLKGINMDLVRGDNGWQEWDFDKLLKALQTWREIHPIESQDIKEETSRRQGHGTRVKAYQTKQTIRGCVYCEKLNHKTVDCPEYTTLDARKKILATKRLCFNCTGPSHRALECKSRSCACGQRHHSSICANKLQPETEGQARNPRARCAKGKGNC